MICISTIDDIVLLLKMIYHKNCEDIGSIIYIFGTFDSDEITLFFQCIQTSCKAFVNGFIQIDENHNINSAYSLVYKNVFGKLLVFFEHKLNNKSHQLQSTFTKNVKSVVEAYFCLSGDLILGGLAANSSKIARCLCGVTVVIQCVSIATCYIIGHPIHQVIVPCHFLQTRNTYRKSEILSVMFKYCIDERDQDHSAVIYN
ncbi:hypothetical protein PHYBLDRAFT_176037 [Phycomyces blakesleeanus NRRL 1555(-)]|uniref:Uncharacterized protein n=1 Tax=Phycomyces blakesleeanus (strain ATCC 8743b / DSM 1359 / FGSC 10004 / NBRC 33097 / NRRL 1555) TaxID=763407 RepID=A0A167JBG6_PHYB8|nr:hypothetical protein PHYBLDRAFT_176037 [Phycomyces blakesleeanus NRRL 1555(-)]OAD65649.1 hypothetical protein PHYBLDRAFT_176037 [Phycomyces blakesleeanus NRRL 1555(-)]|eukprot:XP_018283689.1 hypothetical protein PHYBLDRAFT_176037 [Phycomyces blakesleeanus NRRL 1555(-)]